MRRLPSSRLIWAGPCLKSTVATWPREFDCRKEWVPAFPSHLQRGSVIAVEANDQIELAFVFKDYPRFFSGKSSTDSMIHIFDTYAVIGQGGFGHTDSNLRQTVVRSTCGASGSTHSLYTSATFGAREGKGINVFTENLDRHILPDPVINSLNAFEWVDSFQKIYPE